LAVEKNLANIFDKKSCVPTSLWLSFVRLSFQSPIPARMRRFGRHSRKRMMFPIEALRLRKRFGWAGALPVFALLLAVSLSPGAANAAGPFAGFIGNWHGSGQVVGSNGAERITCRAGYSSSSRGEALSQTLVCASDSYRFDIRSFVVSDDQAVQGHWEELTRSVTGNLVGRIVNGQFDGTVVGSGFTAAIALRISGRKQTVTIVPQGGDITKVDIVLSRSADL
jgi:hypothetical protein